MGVYDRDVRGALGDKAVNQILSSVKQGHISETKMTDIAQRLHKDIVGLHLQRRPWGCGEAEMRNVLNDWFQHGMCSMNQDTALTVMIKVLEDDSIQLLPLAHNLRSVQSGLNCKSQTQKAAIQGDTPRVIEH